MTFIAWYDRDLFLYLTMWGAESQTLQRSSEEGRFIYKTSGKFRFTEAPIYPVYVSVVKNSDGYSREEIVKSVRIDEGDEFTIEVDLAPGVYHIESALNPNNERRPEEIYWGAIGGEIRLRNEGDAKDQKTELVHRKKMRIVSPQPKSVVDTLRPTLVWEPVADAVFYKVDWRCDIRHGPSGRAKVTVPEFTFASDLENGMTYKWSVEAYDKGGEEIAYYSQPSFSVSAPR